MIHSLDASRFLSAPKESIGEMMPIHDLEITIENNDWHLSQSVLDHTIKVFNSVDRIISLENPFVRSLVPIEHKILAYMDSRINVNSRRVLLKISALLHDIGKVRTIEIDNNGKTSCPGHATVSQTLFMQRTASLTIPQSEIEYLASIIGKHHDADSFMDSSNPRQYSDELSKYRSSNPGIVIDLLFFYLFDFEGCKICAKIRDQKPSMYMKVCSIILDIMKESQ